MVEIIKRLASGTTAADDISYTVPDSTSTVIHNITLTNATATAMPFSVHVYGSSDTVSVSNALFYGTVVEPNSTIMVEPGITLNSGETIYVDIQDNSPEFDLAVSVFGSEITNSDNYKIFGQSMPTAQSSEDIYTNSQEGVVSLTRSIVLCNVGGTDDDLLNIAIKDDTVGILNSDYIAWNFAIRPNETIIFTTSYPIEAGSSINVYSENGTTVVTAFGVEYANN